MGKKRINAVRRKLIEDNKAKEPGRTGPMKTLLVRVMMPELRRRIEKRHKKTDSLPPVILESSQAQLDKLLNDYVQMREAILKVYYEKFRKDPIGLMIEAAQPASTEINQNKLKQHQDENGKKVVTGFPCIQCGKPLIVYRLELRQLRKPLYFGKCTNSKHIRLIPLKQEKPEKDGDSIIYTLGKFSQDALPIYNVHIKLDSPHPVKPLDQIGQGYYHQGAVGKALQRGCGGTIASFLSKYQDIIIDHQKVVSENVKRWDKLNEIAKQHGLVFPEITLQEQPRTKETIEVYNDVVAQMMIWTNLNLWQKLKLGRDEAKPLRRLKGFPSFPVVERQENTVDWWKTVNNVRKLISEKKSEGKTFWSNATEEMREEMLGPYLPIEKDRIKKEGVVHNPKKPTRRQFGDLVLHLEKKHGGEWAKVFDEAWERVNKKIDGLIAHVKLQEEQKLEDAQSKAALVDWLRALASFVLEGFKESDQAEFRKSETILQKAYGDLRGDPFAQKSENRVVDISGFSIGSDGSSIQYRSVFAWKYKDDGQRDFYLIVNYSKEGRIKLADKKIRNKTGSWEGLLYEAGNASIKRLHFDESDDQLIILPLAFGKRQGREFIWNDLLSLEAGLLKLANGRIIEKMLYNKKTGQDEPVLFVALAFERREVVDPKKVKPVNLIGVDRGENIPAVIALTDPEGCPLKHFRDESGKSSYIIRIGEGYKEKQKAIQATKETEQKKAGGYSRKYATKARNLADDMVRNAARDLLYYAVTNDAVIVLEDLSRGFGRRGKRTFMTERQYTKMEDWLVAKLAYEGLWGKPGTLRVNQSNSYLAKTLAQYTSKTCSRCGFTIMSADYDNMVLDLRKSSKGWHTKLRGKELRVEGQISYYSRFKKQTVTKDIASEFDRLQSESGMASATDWTKGRREEALFLLKKRFTHRPQQEKFICLECGHHAHADEQAALNIARSWIFLERSPEYKKYQKEKQVNPGNKMAFVNAWQAFYRRMLQETWNPSA